MLLTRIKVLVQRMLVRMGMHEDVGLLPIAAIIGIATAIAAVTFHLAIENIKRILYEERGGDWLYGPGIWLIVVLPAIGGLIVGILGKYVFRAGSGHGVADVIESVIRTRGFIKPIIAIEKILTSAITIGSGGSTGAEGPIVQIGAAISSAAGRVLAISPQQMPIMVGCGTAAGISSIFHAPIAGVIFTLEVIIRDFSSRTLVPIIVASAVANVATQGIFDYLQPHGYQAIFDSQFAIITSNFAVTWSQALEFLILGLLCGLVGIIFTRTLMLGERLFSRLKKLGAARPMVGGLMLGISGLLFVLLFSWLLSADKPVPFKAYPMPAFFGDGYGVIRTMLADVFAQNAPISIVIALLLVLLVMKIIGTTLTLGSGGSGGVIAPSLFMGATTGTLLGVSLNSLRYNNIEPSSFALIGMGATLAAVVHAPLASILIVFELSQNPGVIVPAMIATIAAFSLSKTLMHESIYTQELRNKGLTPESAMHTAVLRKFVINQLPLQAIRRIQITDSIQSLIQLASRTEQSNFVVFDEKQDYCGIITEDTLKTILIQSEAIPLLTLEEVVRRDIRPIAHTENLAILLEAFVRNHTDAIPIGLESDPRQIIGMATRDILMDYYQHQLEIG